MRLQMGNQFSIGPSTCPGCPHCRRQTIWIAIPIYAIRVDEKDNNDEDDDDGNIGLAAFLNEAYDPANQPAKSYPAAKQIVESLEHTIIGDQKQADILGSCAVCQSAFAVSDSVTALPCKHAFHGPCIAPWLKERNTCPQCRYELDTDDAKENHRIGWRRLLLVKLPKPSTAVNPVAKS